MSAEGGGDADALRPYQQEGVAWLVAHPRAILADEMRLGKTREALEAIALMTPAPRVLVIAPKILRSTWVGEIDRWVPQLAGAVAITHFEAAHRPEWQAARPHVLVIDEAHALSRASTRRSAAVRALADRAASCWMLTGTPLTNRPRDLHNLLDTLEPGRWGPFFRFGVRYCNGHRERVSPTRVAWNFDGKSHLDELRAKLARIMLRRTVADVGIQLPPRTRQRIVLDTHRRLPMPADGSRGALRSALDSAADAKLAGVLELVGEHLRAGRRVVAFTHRRCVADSIAEAASLDGYASDIVHGGRAMKARLAAIDGARAWPGAGVLACTIDAAGTGLDLSFADVALFAELTWEPHELLQAEARLVSLASPRPVLVQYCIARGSADEFVAAAIVSKLDTHAAVLGGADGDAGGGLAGTLQDTAADEAGCLASIASAIEASKGRPRSKDASNGDVVAPWMIDAAGGASQDDAALEEAGE